MDAEITKKDIVEAQRVYWWLLLGPALALPCWGINYNLFSQHDFISSVVAAGLPLFVYLPVFFWTFSTRPFVRAHARQGMLLLGLRFLFMVWATYGNDWGVLWCNALLWFFGGGVGVIQAGSGSAWTGNFQARIVAEPQARPAVHPGEALSAEHYLKIFRLGDAAAREDAARRLKALGQVETF